MNSKKLTSKQLREILIAHEDALAALAKAYRQQAEYFGEQLKMTREFMASEADRLDRTIREMSKEYSDRDAVDITHV